ncbi:MAG: metallophosphoesterase [archaeon]
MRVIYATDLHGHKGLFEKLFEERADAVIMGGDVLPNCVVGTEAALDALSTKEYFEIMAASQRDFLKRYLVPRIDEFRKKNKPDVYIMMGNDDFSYNLDLLEDAEKKGILKLLYDKKNEKPKVHEISKDVFIAGYPYVPLTPFGIKDWEKFDRDEKPQRDCNFLGYKSCKKSNEYSITEADLLLSQKDNIAKDLEDFVSDAGKEKIGQMIMVMHSPPSNTVHDIAGFHEGWMHVGSIAIREFIEKYQPLLTLHGHIHESYKRTGEYRQDIGRTICINPGTDKYNLYAVIFDSDNLSDMEIIVKKAEEIEEKPRGP